MSPGGAFLRLLGEVATLAWRGPADNVSAAWRRLYGEEMPPPVAVVEIHRGGRFVLRRPDRPAEVRKLPGELGEGPTLVELAAKRGRDAVLSLFDDLGDV